MATVERGGEERQLYLGVDVGGTKVLAALLESSGKLLERKRCDTPRDGTPQDVLAAILGFLGGALAEWQVAPGQLAAIGLAVPGVVDPDAGKVVVTPNMNLAPLEIVAPIQDRFGVPVALGNDVNLGTLGEKWLGAARRVQSAVGVFVGTGIGGGVILDGKLVRGAREGAGEIGHIVMEVGGPLCGCGNRGCLEALASRAAMERDIRQALAAGRQSLITELLAGSPGPIKSGLLKRALKAGDPLVTEVVQRASEILGAACLTVRHLLDPEMIILGGGVIEACGKFILPIVERVVSGDALPGARPGCEVARSELRDDAIVLGAAALAQGLVGVAPVAVAAPAVPAYPSIAYATFGEICVGGAIYTADITIRGDGAVKRRSKRLSKRLHGTSHRVGPEELAKLCRGYPERVIIGTGETGMAALTPEGEAFLRERGIAVEALPNARAVAAYNRAPGRKAALFHVKC